MLLPAGLRKARNVLHEARNAIRVLAEYFASRDFSPRLRRVKPAGRTAAAILLFSLSGPQFLLAEPSRVAQHSASNQQQMLQKKHNEAAVMMLGGPPGSTYSGIAHGIAAALNGSGGVRLVVMDAPGGVESLRDLLLLRGVDLALVPRNVLEYADATAEFGAALRERLTYVTALYGEEIHILAGAGVTSIKDLNGRKVAVPSYDSNAEFIVHDLLPRLQIQAEVVKSAPADALDDVQSGALAALVLVGGKPLRFVAGLPKDGSLHLLALPWMQVQSDGYTPGGLGADDYPNLIAGPQTIDTLSVVAVIVANKATQSDESYQRIARFVPALFASLSEPSGPRRHPKWDDVNLAATLAGWPRLPAAQEWLNTALREQSASVERNFDDFLRASSPAGSTAPSPAERKQLFDDYLKWTRSTTAAPR